MNTLRKLRWLFDKFPPKHNLILFGQPEFMHHLAMPLNDYDLEQFIQRELKIVKLGINTFDEGAIEVVLRRNLSYGSLVEACRETKMTVTIQHVNSVLIQPHWRSHEQLIQ
jgi:MSHA biogenesis protein MshM